MESDSISLQKTKAFKHGYSLEHPILKEFTLEIKAPKPVSTLPKRHLDNLIDGAMTIYWGVVTQSVREALWMSKNEINTHDLQYSWETHLFFQGDLVKTRNQVKNEDGSRSIVSDKVVHIDWSKGAYGIVYEKGDSLFSYSLETNLQSDPENLGWIRKLKSESMWVREKIGRYAPHQDNYDLVVKGIIRGKNFTMVTSSFHYRTLILLDDQATAIFQNSPNLHLVKKKHKYSPYILIKKNYSEIDQIDLIRLIMLNTLLTESIRVDAYEK